MMCRFFSQTISRKVYNQINSRKIPSKNLNYYSVLISIKLNKESKIIIKYNTIFEDNIYVTFPIVYFLKTFCIFYIFFKTFQSD